MSTGRLDEQKYQEMVENAQTGKFISSVKFKNFIGDVREKINDNWDAFDAHKNDTGVHVTQAEKDKLAGIEPGAQVNQNAFSRVNDVQATTEEDALTVEGGTGIAITTDPAQKRLIITATGEATPGPHASSHITDGTDVIPDAVANASSGLMSGADKAKLDAATSADTPNTLVQRDENGQASFGTPTEATHVATKGYVDANFVSSTTRPTFAAGIQDGDANDVVSIIKSVQHQAHTRTIELSYSDGNLSTVTEKDDTNTIKTTTLNYSGGKLVSVVEVAGGVTVTQTLNYDGSGNLTSVSRAVS